MVTVKVEVLFFTSFFPSTSGTEWIRPRGMPCNNKIQMVSFPVCCLVLPVRCRGRIEPTHAACPPQDPSSIPFSRNFIDSVIFHTIYLYLLRKLALSRTKILAFVTAVPAGFSFSFAFSMFTSSYKTWLCFN